MMAKLERFLPGGPVLLAMLGAYLAIFLDAPGALSDADALWHIAAGEEMLRTGALPAHDSWSFTGQEQPWYNVSWLFDLALGAVHRSGGLLAVYLLPAFLIAILAGLVMRNVRARPGISGNVAVLVLMSAVLAFSTFATARPQLVAFILTACFHHLLHKSRETERFGPLLWLPVLSVLWVNVHGSFMVAVSLLGAYGLEAIMLRRWGWLKRLVTAGAACVAALILNPYGVDIGTAISRTLDSAITKYIQEWLPFVFSSSLGLSLWFLLFIASSNFRENAAPIADRILAAAWFVLMLFSIRHAGSFVILAAPYIAINAQRFVDYLDSIVTHRPDPLAALETRAMRWRLLIALPLAVAASYALTPLVKGEGYRANVANDFTAAIAYAEQNLAGKRLLNDYAMGGQMVYQTRGRVPVFIDGRAGTVFPEEVLEDYITFMFLKPTWDEMLPRYGIEGIIVANSHRFAMAYESGQYQDWQRVYHDEAASIFLPPK